MRLGDQLEKNLGALENAVTALHKKYKSPPAAKRSFQSKRRDTARLTQVSTRATNDQKQATCERKRRKCAPGEVDIGRGKCVRCPLGKFPDKAGLKCEDKCPKGQARLGSKGECEACPKGKLPSPVGDRCEDKCPNNHARVGKDRQCEACAPGRRPNAAGHYCEDASCPVGQRKGPKDKCVSKKEEEEKKKAEEKKKDEQEKKKEQEEEEKKREDEEEERKKKEEDEDKKRKIGRVGRCIQLVSLAFGPDMAADLANSYFSEDVLAGEEMSEFWIDGVPLDPAIDDALDNGDKPKEWALALQPPPNTELPPGAGPRPIKKRFFPALISALVNIAARIGPALANIGSRLVSVAKEGFKLARTNAGRVPKNQQIGMVRDSIIKNRNWERCLRGQKPLARERDI